MEKYQNPKVTIHERVLDLMDKMTLEEKVGQVNQKLYGWETYQKLSDDSIRLSNNFKEHVAWGGGIGALYGIFRADPWSRVDEKHGISAKNSWKISNYVQKYIIENSRLGIPALFVEECPHGHQALNSVSYPTNIGKGSTFNEQIIEETSRNMAMELSNKGVHLALVSTLDLAREPRWGRTEECFGEDPYLAKKYTEATVRGFQGDLIKDNQDFTQYTVEEIGKKKHQIGVVLKHCIAQGDAQGGHNSGVVNIGNRELFEIFYPIMKGAKNAVGVMAAYNEIDGVPCHSNHYLLETLLRQNIGFQGIVMADGGALDRLNKISLNSEISAKMGLQAGVDLSLWDNVYTQIASGVKNSSIDIKQLNKAVYRVLSLKFLLGLFDQPYVEEPEILDFQEKEWQQKNLETAHESVVLLKNNGMLPLSSKVKKIAVIGPNGNEIYNQLGDYTSPQDYKWSTTIYEGLKKRLPLVEIQYAQGCEIRDLKNSKFEEAIALAKESDIVILALGGSSARNFDMEFLNNGAVSTKGINMDSGENVDVADLALGGLQNKLVDEIAKLNKPIISILIQGRPHIIEKVVQKSQAVLIGWYPGQRGGEAIADILIGNVNPSGKLSISIPFSSSQLPIYYNQKDADKKEDYYDLTGQPQYEFGYGLSYSNFEYSDIKVEKSKYLIFELKEGKEIVISINVKNTGSMSGFESVLCFMKAHGSTITKRKKELRNFKKIYLEPGQEKDCQFVLKYEDFEVLNTAYQKVVEPSMIDIMIGTEKLTINLMEDFL